MLPYYWDVRALKSLLSQRTFNALCPRCPDTEKLNAYLRELRQDPQKQDEYQLLRSCRRPKELI